MDLFASPMLGSVEAIFLAGERGAPRTAVEHARAVAGTGLEGDRYFGHPRGGGKRDPERQVTLIEAEAVDAVRATGAAFAPGDARRNVVTRGVRLNELVGRSFRVGGALLRGIERCDPCSRLTRLTYRGVERDLRDRGGLRAEVVEGGEIRVGDVVEAG
ncbi:MAG TPA: MOSC domain-containing protein [Longimicrobium sp.]|jgi:MOSC domain-containing protein YiiM|nr:MOSC domain-containing protein [Longimicrobium sp.]